ncbi:hypothetical protein F5144DRAFT_463765, partial [Chaetomium tenue]
KPLRVLVQTKTHLVPGDKSTYSPTRMTEMENRICRHVWQRDQQQDSERMFSYNTYLMIDNLDCWFLVDHHGFDPRPDVDPPVLWYKWTGTELYKVVPLHLRDPKPERTPLSPAQEILRQRGSLWRTLAMGLGVLDRHIQFVKEHPDHAEWVKTHLPAELWGEVE